MIILNCFTPHDILKNQLCENEEIFIYDEPHGVAITVEEINGHKYYTVLYLL